MTVEPLCRSRAQSAAIAAGGLLLALGIVGGTSECDLLASEAPPALAPGPEFEPGTLVLTASDAANLPEKSRFLVLGFEDNQVNQGRLAIDGRPAFYWRSEELRLQWPLLLRPPLPHRSNLLVVLDANGSGHPDQNEITSGLLEGFVARTDEPTPIELSTPLDGIGADEKRASQRRWEEYRLMITAPGVADLPTHGHILALGFVEEQIKHGWPSSEGRPQFTWQSKELRLRWPVEITVPLPTHTNLLIAVDVNNNYQPDGDEIISLLMEGFTPNADKPTPVVLLGPLSKIGGPSESNPPRRVFVDASAVAEQFMGRDVSLLLAGYRNIDVTNGLPQANAVPVFLHVEDPLLFTPSYALKARLPASELRLFAVQRTGGQQARVPTTGLRLFAVLDSDGDYLPGPDEPTAPASRAKDAVQFVFGAPHDLGGSEGPLDAP